MENHDPRFLAIPSPTIYMTYDYDQFKVLDYNHPINHLSKMSKSIANCNKLYLHPIIVTNNLEIIDGQHRWAYAKETQQALYYVIDKYFEPSDLIAHNVTATNWTAKDYAVFYANCNYQDFTYDQRKVYSFAIEICERFKISYDIFIRLFHSIKNKSASVDFKNGNLKLKISQDEILDVMVLLDEVFNLVKKLNLVNRLNLDIYFAFYHLVRLEGFDKHRFFKKIEENLDLLVTILKFRHSSEIFNRILDLYNKNAKKRLDSPRYKGVLSDN